MFSPWRPFRSRSLFTNSQTLPYLPEERQLRPLMTAFTTFAALLPVMFATGRGADVARAMALPVFSGMLIELVSLFVVPVLYCGLMETKMNLGLHDEIWAASDDQQESPVERTDGDDSLASRAK
jgi:hypothetical protein